MVPFQPHCFAFGGFEIQMLTAMAAARDAGVDIAPLDLWRRDRDFDVIHVWGLDPAHFPTVYWANRTGKGVLLTALLSYMHGLKQRLGFASSVISGRARCLRRMIRLVDVVVVVNELQAEVAERFYGIDGSRVLMIPNIVEARYFETDGEAFSSKYNVRDFILCTGNVCRRKNQVRLAEACIACGQTLVIIGPVLEGEEAYGERLSRILAKRPDMLWIRGLEWPSDELAGAYRACAAFALPSYQETQPISALEAAAAGKPLLLADAWYARQALLRTARRVDPDSVEDIRDGILDVLRQPGLYAPPRNLIARCTSDRVGESYHQGYNLAARLAR